MKRIAFHPAARAELLEAAERYEEQANGLGVQFIDEVERAVGGHKRDCAFSSRASGLCLYPLL